VLREIRDGLSIVHRSRHMLHLTAKAGVVASAAQLRLFGGSASATRLG